MKTTAILFLFGACGFLAPALLAADTAGLTSGAASAQAAAVSNAHGHEWLNWRRYLYQTAQIMFPEDR